MRSAYRVSSLKTYHPKTLGGLLTVPPESSQKEVGGRGPKASTLDDSRLANNKRTFRVPERLFNGSTVHQRNTPITCKDAANPKPSAGLEPATPSLPWKCSTS